jgi:sodium/hydrogen exchanger 8
MLFAVRKRARHLAVGDDMQEGPNEMHRIIGFDGMLLSYVLILLIIAAYAAERFKLPASSAAILIGAIFGVIFRLNGAHDSDQLTSHALITFDEELFLYVLLPPIIFEAGYSLPRRYFFANIGTILLFAVVGTLLSTFVIGQTIYLAGVARTFSSPTGRADALDFDTPLDSYLFGALISATDPVATLSIMGAVNADVNVYTLIFGESVLNDAVAIVLVRILEDMGEGGFSNPSAYLNGILSFFAVSIGSLAVGVVVSGASAILLKRVDLSHHPSFELSLVLLFGYAAYSTAEAVDGSGILALFTTGVLAGHYHKSSLSAAARESTTVALKALAHLAETAVFAYMGVDLFAIAGAGVDAFYGAHATANLSRANASSTLEDPPHEHDFPNIALFVFFALFVVLLARVIVVFPLCLLSNCFRSTRRQLSRRAMAMLVFAGLRGAIAFALAHNVHSEHQASIAAATTTVVMVTVFVLGGATRTVLRCLRMEAAVPVEAPGTSMDGGAILENDVPRSDDDTDGPATSVSMPPTAEAAGSSLTALPSWWQQLDQRYLMPLFGGAGVRHTRFVARHRAGGNGGGIELGGVAVSSTAGVDTRRQRHASSCHQAVAVDAPEQGPAGVDEAGGLAEASGNSSRHHM